MFGRRKRSPEEDSLVPHGMIWYATPEAESDKPAQPKETGTSTLESLLPEVQPQPVVKIPPRPAVGQQATEELKPAVNSSTQLAVPAAQPVATTPTARQPQAFESKPPAFPLPKKQTVPAQTRVTKITAVIDLSEPEAPSKAESFALEIQRRMAWINNRINPMVGATSAWALKNTLAVAKNIPPYWVSVSKFVQSTKGFARGRQHAKSWARNGATSVGVYSQKTRRALVWTIREGVAGSNRVAGSCKEAFMHAMTYAHHHAAGWQPHGRRVRAVLSGLPLRIRILFARQLTRWTLRFEEAGMDARLWTSMTLAAISALIALAIVSVVPHYAAEFLPSRIPPTPSTVSASAPPAANIVVSPKRTEPAATSESLLAGSKLAAKAKKTTVAKMATPKHRRTADDDYVAPDTITYYGDDSTAPR